MDEKLLFDVCNRIYSSFTTDRYKEFLVRHDFYTLSDLDMLIDEAKLFSKNKLMLHTIKENYYHGIFQTLDESEGLSESLKTRLREAGLLTDDESKPGSKKEESTLPQEVFGSSKEAEPSAKGNRDPGQSLTVNIGNLNYKGQQSVVSGQGNVEVGQSFSTTTKESEARWQKILAVVVAIIALIALILQISTDWFGLRHQPPGNSEAAASQAAATTTQEEELLFREDFCNQSSANWKVWDYIDDEGLANWRPRIQTENCRLVLEVELLQPAIAWYRLYEDASSSQVGDLSFQDFDLRLYTKLLDAPNPNDTRLSVHFRIGSQQDQYANYWLWLNNKQEYCLARTPAQNGSLCLVAQANGSQWIKDESLNPLAQGNSIRIVAYGSTIQLFFNQPENNGIEAKGSPFTSSNSAIFGGIALGIQALEGDTVRVEYSDLVVYEETK